MKFSQSNIFLLLIFTLILGVENRKMKSIRQGDITSTNGYCWLEEITKSSCKDMRVSDLLIPGTHDSGMAVDESLGIKEGEILNFIKKNPKTISNDNLDIENDSEEPKIIETKKKLPHNFIHYFTQYYRLDKQLKAGIRLFDIRLMQSKVKGVDDLYIYHGKLKVIALVLDYNQSQIFTEIIKFLNECKNDFVIVKVKLDNKEKVTELFFDNLKKILQENNVKDNIIYYATKEIPKIKEVRGKIWIIPDSFNKDVLKKYIGGINSSNPLIIWNSKTEEYNEKSEFITPFKKYHNYNIFKRDEKSKEFDTFIKNHNDKKNILPCYGFNVSKIANFKNIVENVVGKNAKNLYSNERDDHPGTTKGELLFDTLFEGERKESVNRGFMSIDWATSTRTKIIIDRSKRAFKNQCNK